MSDTSSVDSTEKNSLVSDSKMMLSESVSILNTTNLRCLALGPLISNNDTVQIGQSLQDINLEVCRAPA